MENSHAAEIEIIKKFYNAINRNDIPAAIECLDEEMERIEPEGFPSSGTYRGHAAINVHFSQARATWAEGSCTPERFVVANDKIIVYVHVHVRLKNKLEWIDAHIADGFVFRNNKIIEMRTFIQTDQALTWAGVL